MRHDDDACDHAWHYADPGTRTGALERGLGWGFRAARFDSAAADLVYACIRRDHRWDWQVDERYTYLARLVRDMRLDRGPIVEQLRACGPAGTDDDNQFEMALGVLTTLALSGDGLARDAVRAYAGDGLRWVDVLCHIGIVWPREWWDDLWKIAAARLSGDDVRHRGEPWTSWLGRDPRLDQAIDPEPPERPRHPLAAASDEDLLAALSRPGATKPSLSAALRELRRRPPNPGLLDIAERIAPTVGGRLYAPLTSLGPMIVGPARGWAADEGHPLHPIAPGLLADQGDAADVPIIMADLHRLADVDWCGLDRLVEGLARILTEDPDPARADELIRFARTLVVVTPHSYERAAYLRALLLLDPAGTRHRLRIHLHDCEDRVRLLAAEHTPLTDNTRRWLADLRDDPIEDPEVRAAAAARS